MSSGDDQNIQNMAWIQTTNSWLASVEMKNTNFSVNCLIDIAYQASCQ